MIKLDAKAVLAVGAVALVAVYLARRQVIEVAKNVGAAVNPVSRENVFYKGTNAVVNALAGDGEDASLGTRLYDWIHGGK